LFSHAIGSADVISDWNAIMVTAVSGQSLLAQGRFASITQLAVFEAIPEVYVPVSTDPGQYQRTPGCSAGGTFLHWRYLTPFSIRSGDQFQPDPPPALTSMTYGRDYNELKEVGGADGSRPQDRTNEARCYRSTPPFVVWNAVARQLGMAKMGDASKTPDAVWIAVGN
jgi:hypothetical protein